MADVAVTYMPDGYIVAGTNDGTIHVWEANAPYTKVKTYEGHNTEVTSFAILPNGNLMSNSWGDGNIKVWKKGTFELLKTFGEDIHAMVIMPDERILASTWNEDANVGTIQVWKADFSEVEANIKSMRGLDLQVWGDKWIGNNRGVISVFEID